MKTARLRGLEVLLLATFVAAAAGAQQSGEDGSPPKDVLSRRLPEASLKGVTIARAFWHVLNSAGLPGGIVSIEGRPEEERMDLTISDGATLRQALDQIVSRSRGLAWKMEGGVVDLFPPSATASMQMLNVRIAAFDFPDASNVYLAAQELAELPEVKREARALGFVPTPVSGGLTGVYYGPGQKRPPPIPVHLRNVTLLQALNALMRARGEANLWLYKEGSWSSDGRTVRGFDVTLGFAPPG
jgi:hypothetical protein